jgi:hypothetical protein
MTPPDLHVPMTHHANEDTHRRIMARLAKMTPEEVFQTAVQAGIYTPDGQLTEPDATTEPSASRPND